MLEVAHSGAEHCDAALVGLLYRILVAYATARLYDCSYAILCSQSYGVIEGEETVRSQYQALCKACSLCLLESNLGRTYAVHLACTNTYGVTVLNNNDSVRLNVLNDSPAEVKVCNLLCGWLCLCYAHLGSNLGSCLVQILNEQATVYAHVLVHYALVLGHKIGRASCRERV